MKTVKTNRLSERAMLVHLRILRYAGHTKDNEVVLDVCSQKQATQDSGGWYTYLIPKKELSGVNHAASRCREIHNHYTFPWLDGGMRILPSLYFFKYREAIATAIAEYDEAVEIFLTRYPDIVTKSKERLGQLNRIMPSVKEIQSKFAVSHSIFPLPETEDFRVKLADEEKESVKATITDSLNATMTAAVSAVWGKLAKSVEKIAAATKDKDKQFRNVLFTNLVQLCEDLPQLNFTNDVKLEEVRQHILTTLAKFNPDDVREDSQKRKAAAKAAKDVLNKMKDYATT